MIKLTKDEKNQKKELLKAFMSNGRMSSIMKDAYRAPLGSTSRRRAQHIINIMRKVGAAPMDGAGGPGTKGGVNMMAPRAPDYSRMLVFPKAPMPNPSNDGQGGPGGNAFLGLFGGLSPQPSSSPFQPGTGMDNYFTQKPQIPIVSPWNINKPASTPPAVPSGPMSYADPIKNAQMNPGGMSTMGGASDGGPVVTQPNVPTTPGAITTGGAQTGGTTGGTTPTPGSGTPGGTTPTPGASVPSLVQGAVNKDTGPTAFALGMMNDPASLRKLPGFENLPDSALPHGASLVGQVNELSDTLRKEYQLDSLLDEKNRMVREGTTYIGDFSDYVRGKDEYLNQVQTLLDGFNSKTSTMDLGNPETAKQAQSYVGYLTALKGRQNQRYIDFLNTGVNLYNSQLTNVTQNYDKALQSYQFELEKKAPLLQEQWQTYFSALTEMYNTAADAPKKATELEYMKVQIAAANATIASDAYKAGQMGNGLNTDLQKVVQNMGIAKQDLDGNTRYVLAPGANFTTLMNTFNDGLVDPRTVAEAAKQLARDTISFGGEPDRDTANILRMADEYKNSGGDETFADAVKSDAMAAYKDSSSVRSVSAPDKTQKIREMAKSLATPGFWGSVPKKEQFITQHSDTGLSAGFLGLLYDDIVDYKKVSPGGSEAWFFKVDSMPDNEIVNESMKIAERVPGLKQQ